MSKGGTFMAKDGCSNGQITPTPPDCTRGGPHRARLPHKKKLLRQATLTSAWTESLPAPVTSRLLMLGDVPGPLISPERPRGQ